MPQEMGQGEGTLSKAAGLVVDAKADFDGLKDTLTNQIAGIRGMWVGQGGSAFFNLQEAWTQRQTTILNALNEFEASLRSTEKDNTTTDDTQSANFNRNASRLG
jgi:WXG100 family type VII secretion target